MDKQQQFFTIQQLSQKLNIPKPTLRFWEMELDGIIVPHRTSGGQRRYTFEHVSIIEKINNLRREGMSLAEIKRELRSNNNFQHDNLDSNKMDLLVKRIAEVVREEVSSFFNGDDPDSKIFKVDES